MKSFSSNFHNYIAGVLQVLDVSCGVATFSTYLLPLKLQTFSFAPKRWAWETDSIYIRERNWWSDLCFSHKQLPYPSRAWDGSLFNWYVDWHENASWPPKYIYLYCISWMGNGNLEPTISIIIYQLVWGELFHNIWRNWKSVWFWKYLMKCCLINSQ